MINSTLFKKSLKSNYKIILIFIMVLVIYSCIIVSMFDPKDMSYLKSFSQMNFPPELLNAFGFDLNASTLTGFIASFLYGMLMLVFPMIAYIIIANRLIASMVDKGSMASLLSTPNSRKKIAITQGVFLISAVTFIIVVISAVILLLCRITNPGYIDVSAFIKLNLGLLLLHFSLSSISFCSSCVFNESAKSLMLGGGIPTLFYIIQMLANSSDKVSGFKYFTLFTLFNNMDIVKGNSIWLGFLTMFLIGIVLYISGIVVFSKKDLCL